MSIDPINPTPIPPPASSGFSLANVIFATLIPTIIIVAVAGYFYITAIPENPGNLDFQIGLADRVIGDRTKLSEAFTDANGDLVADTPSDASKLVDPEKLLISHVASADSIEQAKKWQPLMDMIQKTTGKPVEYVILTDTNEQLSYFKEGKLHIAAFNTGTVPAAVNLTGFVPYCSPVTTGSTTGYQMVFIVPKESAINTPADIKGKTLAVTNVMSHSGYKMPLTYLRDEFKMYPGKDYDLRLSGGHAQSIKGIQSDGYEVAAVASDLLSSIQNAGGIKEGDYRVIHRSDTNQPAAPWGYAYNLKPELQDKIKQAFDAYTDPKFQPISYVKDWDYIRKVDSAMLNWNSK